MLTFLAYRKIIASDRFYIYNQCKTPLTSHLCIYHLKPQDSEQSLRIFQEIQFSLCVYIHIYGNGFHFHDVINVSQTFSLSGKSGWLREKNKTYDVTY